MLVLLPPPPSVYSVLAAQGLSVVIVYVNPFIAGFGLVAPFYRLRKGQLASPDRSVPLFAKLLASILTSFNVLILGRLVAGRLTDATYPLLFLQVFALAFIIISLYEVGKRGLTGQLS